MLFLSEQTDNRIDLGIKSSRYDINCSTDGRERKEAGEENVQNQMTAASFAELKESAFDGTEKKQERLEEAFIESLCLSVR